MYTLRQKPECVPQKPRLPSTWHVKDRLYGETLVHLLWRKVWDVYLFFWVSASVS